MLKPEEDTDETLRAWRETLRAEAFAEAEAHMRRSLEGFRQDLREHPYVRELERRRRRKQWLWVPVRKGVRMAIAIGSSAAALILLAVWLLGRGTPSYAQTTWSEVAERFRSVSFFSATIYAKQSALAQPEETELWMGRGGRVRIRVGTKVIFAQNGKVTKAFDIQTRQETSPDAHSLAFLERLVSKPEFSLEVVLSSITAGRIMETTWLVNPAQASSPELLVFDIQRQATPEWIRVWALAESKLPTRMRFTDPRNGGSIDAIFSYTKDQPAEFFDPSAFEKSLRLSASGGRGDAYALMKDPAGRVMTPEQLFAATGYHMPVVEEIGISPEGAVWVVAGRARNARPDGWVFFGFQELEDDLGRTYCPPITLHQTVPDRSIQIFVPEEYPFDDRVPGLLRFICMAEPPGENARAKLIGKVEVTEWKRGERWPAEPLITDPLISQAWRLLEAHKWARLDRLLAVITGELGASPLALDREKIRLAALVKQGKFADAVKLGAQLMPFLEQYWQVWHGWTPSTSMFNDYIIALAAVGRMDEAREVVRKVAQLVPLENPDLPKLGQERVLKDYKTRSERNLEILAGELFGDAKLSIETINSIMGVDVRTDERFKRVPAFREPLQGGK